MSFMKQLAVLALLVLCLVPGVFAATGDSVEESRVYDNCEVIPGQESLVAATQSLECQVKQLLKAVQKLGAAIASAALVGVGIMYFVVRDDPEKVDQAKKWFKNILIGAAIVIIGPIVIQAII